MLKELGNSPSNCDLKTKRDTSFGRHRIALMRAQVLGRNVLFHIKKSHLLYSRTSLLKISQ